MKIFNKIYYFLAQARDCVSPICRKTGVLMLGGMTIFLSGCLQDKMEPCPVPGDNDNNSFSPNPQYYIEVNVEVPADLQSRANGDDLAVENEQKVEAVDLFFLNWEETSSDENPLASDKNTVLLKLSSKTYPQSKLTRDETNKVKYTAKIYCEEEEFKGLANLAGKKVNLLVVCNPDKISYTLSSEANKNNAETSTFNVGSNSAPIGYFKMDENEEKDENVENVEKYGLILPMANASNYILDDSFENISGDSTQEIIEAIKGLFSPVGSEMIKNLGALDVERMVSRLDIAGIPGKTDSDPEDWTYNVDGTEINLQLVSLTPVNVAKSSYIARHVAGGDTEFAKEDWFFLKREENNNYLYDWIADPTWEWDNESNSYTKKDETDNPDTFLNPVVYDEETGYSISATGSGYIKDIKIETISEKTIKGYHPFCYVTENTVPNVNTYFKELKDGGEIYKYVTGVAFKFVVLALPDEQKNNEREPLTSETDDNLIPKGITFDESGKMRITDSNDYYVEVEPEGDKYYLTYYGFIKNSPESMIGGQKELTLTDHGVVRNTVYQLRVNKIENLPNPHEPDSYFIALDLKVLSWAKHDISVSF